MDESLLKPWRGNEKKKEEARWRVEEDEEDKDVKTK